MRVRVRVAEPRAAAWNIRRGCSLDGMGVAAWAAQGCRVRGGGAGLRGARGRRRASASNHWSSPSQKISMDLPQICFAWLGLGIGLGLGSGLTLTLTLTLPLGEQV